MASMNLGKSSWRTASTYFRPRKPPWRTSHESCFCSSCSRAKILPSFIKKMSEQRERQMGKLSAKPTDLFKRRKLHGGAQCLCGSFADRCHHLVGK